MRLNITIPLPSSDLLQCSVNALDAGLIRPQIELEPSTIMTLYQIREMGLLHSSLGYIALMIQEASFLGVGSGSAGLGLAISSYKYTKAFVNTSCTLSHG